MRASFEGDENFVVDFFGYVNSVLVEGEGSVDDYTELFDLVD